MNVLFVDDETRVLEAMERVLIEMDCPWQVSFMSSGDRALSELARASYDVVVSDLRMPGMDGVELLTRVAKSVPRVVRIVLSGHGDEEAALKVAYVAHQFLAKPCATETLHDVIRRTEQFAELLPDQRLRTLVGGLGALPSDAGTHAELARLVEGGEASAETLAAVVRRDPAWTAKLLQIASSAFFNSSASVTDVETAIMRLGLRALRNLIRSPSAPAAPTAATTGATLERLRSRAQQVAELAAALATFPEDAAIAYVAGLLCDVGQLVLLSTAPERQYLAESEAAQRGIPQHAAERDVWGATHAEVGAYLLGLWGLPVQIVEAVANHHAPERGAFERLGPTQLVWLASCIVDAQEPSRELLSMLGAEQLLELGRRRFREATFA